MKTASFFTYTGPGRISIARYAPRGTPKGFRCFKELAPGTWFNSVTPARYVELFAEEILAPLDPKLAWDALHHYAGGHEPVLLCWEKPTDREKDPSTYCHRAIVAQWLSEAIGERVDEIGYEGQRHPLHPHDIQPRAPRVPALPKRQRTLFG